MSILTQDPSGVTLLGAGGIGKRFGDSWVLQDVDLEVRAGIVHGLIGRNGAGKSTLVGILTGRAQPDRGALTVRGAPVTFAAPGQAVDAGVVAVPQEIVLPMGMTVEEVVTLGVEPTRGGFVRRRATRAVTRAVLERLRVDIDPGDVVSTLPTSSQKVVLVAQALARDATTIILDEPTSGMEASDAEKVQDLVATLRDEGLGLLYISHRLEEVERLCQEVTVLRDGKKVGSLDQSGIHQHALVEAMMAEAAAAERPVHAPATPRAASAAAPRAPLERLVAAGISGARLRDFSIAIAPGEIVGLAGLPGSGVGEAFRMLAGVQRPALGEVALGAAPIVGVREALERGVAFLPADRGDVALPSAAVLENLILCSLDRCATRAFVRLVRARAFSRSIAERLGVGEVLGKPVGQLSGGNQQRVLVGARLLVEPRMLVLEDPTVGIDISARANLHQLIRELADDGLGCVVGSSDPQELAELCHRVVVVRDGAAVTVLEGDAVTEYGVVEAMIGAEPDGSAEVQRVRNRQ